MFKGFHIQMLLLVVVPTALVLIVVAVGGSVLHERAMRDLVGERDARATEVAADNLTERLNQRENALTLIATLMDHQSLAELQSEEISRLFDYGLIMSADGDLLDSWLPAGDWEWREATGSSPAFVGHNTEGVLVVFSVNLPDSDLSLYGASSLSAMGIPDMLHSLTNNHETRAYLVDQDGHLLYSTIDEPIGRLISPQPAVSAALRGETGFQQSEQDKVIGYSAVSRLGWALVIEEPWHAVSSPQLQMSHLALLMVITGIMLGLLATAFSALSVVRPLQNLETRARRLMNGDYSMIQEKVGGIQEIRDLQYALIQMAQSVQQAQARLHEYIGVITTAQEDERHRLARDLHDEVVQTLIALNQHAQKAQRSMERDPGAVLPRLAEVRGLSEKVVQDIRRLIHDLRPTYLTELGLIPALEMLAEQEQAVQVKCLIEGETRRLSDNIELALYRITQEALNNLRKHSQATRAWIRLCFEADQVRLVVEDNGQGFEVPSLHKLPTQGHYGLLGIQERAQLIHAQLTIKSQLEVGTTIKVEVKTATL